MTLPQRLGRNRGGYLGERIEIEAVLRDSLDWARRWGWEVDELISHKTRRSYTLEAPSDFALSVRVAALVAGVRTALASLDAA